MIDAHQHYWQITRAEVTWPTPELAAIHRDFLPADLDTARAAAGIDGTVLVQSQPSAADTAFLLDLAGTTDSVKGVVGWCDLSAPEAPERVARLAADPLLKGLRPMLQGLDDDDWILRPAVAQGLAAMQMAELRFDALIFPRHLCVIAELADRYRELQIVIDHGAKPPLASGQIDAWERAIRETAARENVCCKLSGLPVEAGSGRPEAPCLRRAADVLLDTFGEERLIWGSDWPVVNLVSGYGEWLATCLALTGPSEAIYGGNASRFYDLDPTA